MRTLSDREVVGVVDRAALARADLIQYLRTKGCRPMNDAFVNAYQNVLYTAVKLIAGAADLIYKACQQPWVAVLFLAGAALLGSLGSAPHLMIGNGLVGLLIGGAIYLALFFASVFTYSFCHASGWACVPYGLHVRERKVPAKVVALAASIQQERPDLNLEVERFQFDPFLTVSMRDVPSVSFRIAWWTLGMCHIPRAR